MHHLQHTLERLGLPVGIPTLLVGVVADIQSHGQTWLSTLAILVGIVATGGSFVLRLLDYLDRRSARAHP